MIFLGWFKVKWPPTFGDKKVTNWITWNIILPYFTCINPTARCCLIGWNLQPFQGVGHDSVCFVLAEAELTSPSGIFYEFSPVVWKVSNMNFMEFLYEFLSVASSVLWKKTHTNLPTKRWCKMAMNLMLESVEHHQINKHKLIMAY